jgi:hypothetical protein
MYCLLNRDEVVGGLARRMLARRLKKIQPAWAETMAYINKMQKRLDKTGLLEVDFGTVNNLLHKDIQTHKDFLVTEYKQSYRKLVSWLSQNVDRIDIDRKWLIDSHVNNPTRNFVKTLGQQLAVEPAWVIPGDTIPDEEMVLIRNIINNEHLLRHRMTNNLPFLFLDTGYTNFLTGKKQWHRLVVNHLHHNGTQGSFPADRLHMFPSMPAPWRTTGREILVVENSNHHFEMFGTTLRAWRQQVREELERHTDRPIVFRSKNPNRKTRDNLYEHLKNNDYYCVVLDASASAIEAIWAGVPIITLNRHISTPVARTKLSDVNDLYRGNIGDWLCALSYSQFTQKEFYNGTALRLIEQYHV